MSKKIMICWLGVTDLKASQGVINVGLGPIAQAVEARTFDEVVLLNDLEETPAQNYVNWLKKRADANIVLSKTKLSGPTNFGEIYQAAVKVIQEKKDENGDSTLLTIHLSPGTPAMAAVWILVTKTKFPETELIESSQKHGVQTVSIPFDISADFIPDLLRKSDITLEKLAAGLPYSKHGFNNFIHSCADMKRVVLKARMAAAHSIPILIEGESGTGKEDLSKAIHISSPRYKKPFITVNCGAIPKELIESELFGHEKGAFTGADKLRYGYFEVADGGTLFLDEVGELPAKAQVKLLRTLQEKEIVRVGATKPIKIDVRIICATNRSLTDEVRKGNFREDLYYRIAVATLNLPPLRNRGADVGLLIEEILAQVNKEVVSEMGYEHKKLSASAKNILLRHSWPGNVRELQNTLTRAAVWSPGDTLSDTDIREALLPAPVAALKNDEMLNRSLENGIDLPEIMSTLARHYLKRALEKTNHNKSKASQILGLSSYQTLTNWLKKYGLE